MDDKIILKQIGNQIRKMRISQNMTQADLAFAANISASNVSDIELGKTKIWITTFARIVEALQVSADLLLRSDTPEVNKIYSQEFADLLSDCSPQEIDAIIAIVTQVKKILHSKNDMSDN